MNPLRFRQREFDRFLGEAADVAGALWHKGWAERNAGNMSGDVTDYVDAASVVDGDEIIPWCEPDRDAPPMLPALDGRFLWITGNGSHMRHIARDPAAHTAIIRFSDAGRGYRVVWTRGPRPFVPTSELPTHAAIHALLRTRQMPHRVIVHTHPDDLIVMSHDAALLDATAINNLLWRMHPETPVVLPDGLGFVPYVLPGSVAQGLATARVFERHFVALWEKHGVVAIGADFDEAFDRIDTLNKSARMYLMARAAGFSPAGLSDAQLAELFQAFHGRERW